MRLHVCQKSTYQLMGCVQSISLFMADVGTTILNKLLLFVHYRKFPVNIFAKFSKILRILGIVH